MSNSGPWGSGGGKDDKPRDPGKRPSGNRGPGNEQGIPEIEDFMKKGSEQLKVLMGGGGNRRTGGGSGRGPGSGGPLISIGTVGIVAAVAVGLWAWASFYTVKPEERSVELMFGREYSTGGPGLNFAPWPIVTHEIVQVTREQTVDIGRSGGNDSGLMLTGDQNIVDVEFQVVWNINDPAKYLFNLADPQDTIRAVSESAMRDIIARSELAPILNRDRGMIAADLRDAVQGTLDSYDAGINVIRVNFNRADPPREVIDSFRQVQAAQQERDRLEKEADAYANRVTAAARGQAAQLREEAEAYRAQTVNDAQGEAARFTSVFNEYVKAPDVTKRRMFLETMENLLRDLDKVIIDQAGSNGEGGQGVVPYLPLNELRRTNAATAQSTGGSN